MGAQRVLHSWKERIMAAKEDSAVLTPQGLARLLPWAVIIAGVASGWAAGAARMTALECDVADLQADLQTEVKDLQTEVKEFRVQNADNRERFVRMETDLQYIRMQIDQYVVERREGVIR